MSRPKPPPGPRGEAPVSVAVVARDEQDRLPRTLRSVGWAAETVVVVDSRTRDRTADVARGHGARVVVREWRGYAEQKARALAICRCPWVLLLDADEVVSPELAREIVGLLAGTEAGDAEGGPAGWEIPFHTLYLGHWLGRRGWYRERHLRLVRKDRAAVAGGPVHEGLTVDGEVGRLSGPVLHRSYRDPVHHAGKIAVYARLKARGLRERGRSASLAEAVGRACASFLRGYLLRGRFLDGTPGLVWELMGAYYELVTYAHLRELGADGAAGGGLPDAGAGGGSSADPDDGGRPRADGAAGGADAGPETAGRRGPAS